MVRGFLFKTLCRFHAYCHVILSFSHSISTICILSSISDNSPNFARDELRDILHQDICRQPQSTSKMSSLDSLIEISIAELFRFQYLLKLFLVSIHFKAKGLSPKSKKKGKSLSLDSLNDDILFIIIGHLQSQRCNNLSPDTSLWDTLTLWPLNLGYGKEISHIKRLSLVNKRLRATMTPFVFRRVCVRGDWGTALRCFSTLERNPMLREHIKYVYNQTPLFEMLSIPPFLHNSHPISQQSNHHLPPRLPQRPPPLTTLKICRRPRNNTVQPPQSLNPPPIHRLQPHRHHIQGTLIPQPPSNSPNDPHAKPQPVQRVHPPPLPTPNHPLHLPHPTPPLPTHLPTLLLTASKSTPHLQSLSCNTPWSTSTLNHIHSLFPHLKTLGLLGVTYEDPSPDLLPTIAAFGHLQTLVLAELRYLGTGFEPLGCGTAYMSRGGQAHGRGVIGEVRRVARMAFASLPGLRYVWIGEGARAEVVRDLDGGIERVGWEFGRRDGSGDGSGFER